ncbi:MAG: hypothetical protein ABR591_04480 [Candidatus Velthaea sp.]
MIRRIVICVALAFGVLAAGPEQPPAPVSSDAYRAVALAMSAGRLVLAGGGVLRLAAGCACEGNVAGHAVALTLDASGAVVQLHRAAAGSSLRAASDIPAQAYLFAVQSSTNGDPNNPVTLTIVAAVPAQTPPGDDVYVSTERSSWNPAELRMNRVDALHWSLSLSLPRGAHVAFRFTRGSFATTERNEARQLPPAHVLVAEAGAKAVVTVPAWADIN